MHNNSLAPVLSATRSRDSCWITELSCVSSWFSAILTVRRAWPNRFLLRALENLHDPPALRGRQRTGLHQEDPVADAALVLLVVRLELARSPHDLAVERVLDPILDGHDDGLVHLVAHHETLAYLAKAAAGSGIRLRALLIRSHAALAHSTSSISTGVMPSSRSCMIV